MKVVIAGASGNIGYRVAEQLLHAGERPVLLARNAAKVASLLARGAVLVEGGSDDTASVMQATQNADALLWLTPPALAADSLQQWYARTARIACDAIAANGVARVVHISSIGAGARPNLGTVSYSAEVENAFAATRVHLVNLRPGYFMQNLAAHYASMRDEAVIRMSFAPDHDMPWISTDDIGDVAARYLLDTTWAGQWARNLMGPENLSLQQVAAIASEILGRQVRYEQASLAQLDRAFAHMGANAQVRTELAELMTALGDPDGIYATARTPDACTPTSMQAFLRAGLNNLA
ncbi:NmrA family NAD(P)-binding protein [Janthinobacterium sp. Mn2066]|uniref:NmrA family NAD(P)-binding protein n=1 Tax=Janthinobacterium sp. Mn2066 TaxID=3395264 RepID=UPI003BEDA46E